ncbi:MAG: hypothetical protein DRG30_05465 [Epsilonproteobacteria bacterium]|nr:MAG: hypothetical protein DRG30_05465 [Campylobacterota bacterium]
MTVIGEQAAWVSQAFVDASGGMDKALSNVQGFIDGFYTDAEKQALRVDKLSSTGLFGSEELYKAQVKALTAGSAGGDVGAAKQLAELLRLQSEYRDYYDYINTAEQDSLDKRKEAAEEELAFHEDILSRIESAYTGALNYMTNTEKSVALASIAKTKLESGDTQGYFDTLYNQLEYDKSTSATKEDYVPKFESYIAELENADYEKKTLDDVVDKLDELIDATEGASYQEPLGTQYYEGARV